jgi:hypothetical protein
MRGADSLGDLVDGTQRGKIVAEEVVLGRFNRDPRSGYGRSTLFPPGLGR